MCSISKGRLQQAFTEVVFIFRHLNEFFQVCIEEILKNIIIFNTSVIIRVNNLRENVKVNTQLSYPNDKMEDSVVFY